VEDTQSLAAIHYNPIHRINIRDCNQQQVDVWATLTSKEVTGWLKKFERQNPFVAIADNLIVGFAEFEPNAPIDCF
jgi:putative acetyltransferase